MKKVLPQNVWTNAIEIDLTNLSLNSILKNLEKALERIESLKEKIVEIKGTDFSTPVDKSLDDLKNDVEYLLNNSGGESNPNLANKTLNETITGFWTFTNPTTIRSIMGPNNQDLLITGKNYGVEIRIDEDSSENDIFRITSGSDSSSTTLVLVKSTGNVGIGTDDPTQKLEVSGNIKGGQFISTVTTGTAPLQVSSTTRVTNLNADLLDGYETSITPQNNTIPVRESQGQIIDGFSFGQVIGRRYMGYIYNSGGTGTWVKLASITLPSSSNNGAYAIFKVARNLNTYSLPVTILTVIDYASTPRLGASLDVAKFLNETPFVDDVAIVQTGIRTFEVWIKVLSASHSIVFSAEVLGNISSFIPTIGETTYESSPPNPTFNGVIFLWSSGSSYNPGFIQFSGIVDQAFTSTGGYIRYANGTQIAWGVQSPSSWNSVSQASTTVGVLTLYYKTLTEVLPAAFSSPPVITVGGDVSGTQLSSISIRNISSTSFSILVVYQISASTINTNYFAIGRWK